MTNEQPDRSGSSKRETRRWAMTPASVVAGGLLLWIASGAAAVLAHMALWNVTFADRVTELVFTYLLYAPAVAFALLGMVTLIIGAIRWAMLGRDAAGAPEQGGQGQVLELLESINRRLLLSDAAKRIASRSHDLEALRRGVEQDIAHGQFDAAMVLVNELGQSYGYREESETYRERINAARAAQQDAKIAEELAELDGLLASHDFEAAERQAGKLERLFGDSARVRGAHKRVIEAREQYKHELEREFLTASENDDVDRALDLLKKLDKYLSEQEAAPLRETARGVIGKKRDNLGVQFKMAVHDREWTQAVRVGEQIIREFPNSRMAEEVRSMIDPLRQRAANQMAVG